MLSQLMFLLFLHPALVFLTYANATTLRSEYAKIAADVEYVPHSSASILTNISYISSQTRCSVQCMFNPLCFTATYYEDLELCSLFSTATFQGAVVGRSQAKVICMIDRVLGDTWYPLGTMTSARDFHKSTFIAATSSVFIVGGSDGSSPLSSTELFLSSNSSFVPLGNTQAPRRYHTVNHLNDHLVVIAGGWFSAQTADLYDPLAGVSNISIQLSAPRAEHTSAVITDSSNLTTKLLLVGGLDGTGMLASGDVYDMTTGVFRPVGNSMTSPRYYHAATTLNNGLVLLTGGMNNNSVVLDTIELYNSSSNLFVPLSARMSTARAYHTATYIPSIQAVLIVGGRPQIQAQALHTYDLLNVTTFTFTVLNRNTLEDRSYHTATLLLDEQVLIVGGQNTVRLPSCELYNPLMNTFISVANMSTDRADHTATLLSNTGQVLICGGQNTNNIVLDSCELYQP